MREPESPSVETRIVGLASRQHGVVTRAQLLGAGLTASGVDSRVRSRRLRPVHRGIYLHGALVGPLEPRRAREMAAVLACGSGAVVSHGSAASMWGLVHGDRTGSVDVTIPGADRGRRPGIRPHRVAALPAAEVAAVDGVPVTAPARTLVDLAPRVRPRALEQALARALRRDLLRLEDVAAALNRRPRAWGALRLRQLLDAPGGPAFTRSEAEDRFLALIRKGGLSAPEANVREHGVELDFLWRSERVAVEVDGFAFHSSRRTFELDRRRDARLAGLGLQTLRVTWNQLVEEPHAVLVRLAQVLALARTGPPQGDPSAGLGSAPRGPRAIPARR